MGDYNPAPKRHIGPAIRWAKPKNGKTRSARPRKHEIRIDLPDVVGDSNITDLEETQRDTPGDVQDEQTSPLSRDAISHRESYSPEPAADDTNGTWWQRTSGNPSETRSAWSEYAASLKRRAGERYSAYESQTEDSVVTYDYGTADAQSPAGDQPSLSQHNPRSYERIASAAPQSDRTGWVKYLLPIAVVASVIFLAFLTLGT